MNQVYKVMNIFEFLVCSKLETDKKNFLTHLETWEAKSKVSKASTEFVFFLVRDGEFRKPRLPMPVKMYLQEKQVAEFLAQRKKEKAKLENPHSVNLEKQIEDKSAETSI